MSGSTVVEQPPEASTQGLERLFHPESIAVVGASGRVGNPFARPLQYLVEYGFSGAIHPINPRHDELFGRRCLPSLDAVDGPIDLALLMVPAAAAVDVLPEVAAAGAKAAVVFASGFGEAGPDGAALQQRLAAEARRLGIRILGPNCQGVLNAHGHVFGTFTAALELGPIRPGGLAYVGQSGAVGGSILSLARERGVGVASWASTGNQVDLTTVEVARFLADEPETEAVALYVESTVDPVAFRDLAARTSELGKSLIVLRSATSAAGARAAASHTGAIVGDDAHTRVTMAEYGVIEAEDIDDLVQLGHAHTSLPRTTGTSLTIITTSGGAGSLAADHAENRGLVVDALPPAVQASLAEVVPVFGAVDNPVDVTAQIFRDSDVSEFVEVCDRVLDAPEVDAVLITLTLVTGDLATAMAKALVDRIGSSSKPVALVWAAARQQTEEARELLRDAGIPVFDSSHDGVRVLRSLVRPSIGVPATTTPPFDPHAVAAYLAEAGGTLTEHAATRLLDLVGVDRPWSRLLTDAAQAHDVADPATLVAKIQSPHVLHKTERGGVVTDVTPDALPEVVVRLLDAFRDDEPEGVLVQEHIDDGVELLVGLTRGGDGAAPLVTVGIGGITAELYRDTATTFAPVAPDRARELLLGLRASALLTGFRGRPAVDLDRAADAISRISHLGVLAGDRLRELEVNPLRATADGRVIALDFLMVTDDHTPATRTENDA